jgi:hypothetical protein
MFAIQPKKKEITVKSEKKKGLLTIDTVQIRYAYRYMLIMYTRLRDVLGRNEKSIDEDVESKKLNNYEGLTSSAQCFSEKMAAHILIVMPCSALNTSAPRPLARTKASTWSRMT